MSSLEQIVGSYTPLTRAGEEWQGACPITSHPEPIAVIGTKWRCFGCAAHEEHGDEALGFLLAIGMDTPQALERVHAEDWTPTLTKPTPKPHKYAISRITERPEATVLITDHRKAAAVVAKLLPKYAPVAWPDGGSRWDGLEPLRGRNVLLWPSPDGVADMERLEAVLADPAGLACKGKIVAPLDLAAWDKGSTELIAWAKANVRPLRIPNPAVRVVDAGFAPASAGNVAMPSPPSSEASPPPAGPIEDDQDAPSAVLELDAPPEPDFPPEATLARPAPLPRKRKPRLAAVDGNLAVDVDQDEAVLPLALSESGVGAEFAALHKDKFRVCHELTGKHGPMWFAWDGSRWLREPNRVSAFQKAEALSHTLKYRSEANSMTHAAKHKFETKKFLGAVLDFASHNADLIVPANIFDADPFLLGTPAGDVDLRLGKLLEHDQSRYITRQTSVAPVAGPHPLFDDVIRRASAEDPDIAAYLWRWLSLLCTGDISQECFLYIIGKPQSGKTTLITAVADILGDVSVGGYATAVDIAMFTEQKIDKGSDQLAHLAGARFAYASEMEEGKNFKAALLKMATGGDRLTGRFLYAEKFSYTPTHKLVISGNTMIHLKSSDAGLKRRLHLLEYQDAFVVTDEERDNSFKERLRAEYPAILHSMIKGVATYLEYGGLGRPERIQQAVENYADSEDTLGQWIADCLDLEARAQTPSSAAYECFRKWAEKEGAFTPSSKRFSQQLVERGFARARSGGVRQFVGFSVKVGANL